MTEHRWDGNQWRNGRITTQYYGRKLFRPNPQMGFWYLGALKAAEKMAHAMKDRAFEKKCRALFENGSKWLDNNLFNGEYMSTRSQIRKPLNFST